MGIGFLSRRPEAAAVPAPPSHIDPAELVTEPSQIARLLEGVRKQHMLLAVSLPGVDYTYNSAVLEIVAAEHYFVLDELTPQHGHALAVDRRQLRLQTRVGGAVVSFESTIAAVGGDKGIPYYKVPFPAYIHYHQRREHYRAPVPLEKSVGVHFLTRDQQRISAELRDISLGGLSARLVRGAVTDLAVGQVMPRCVITLPNLHKVSSAFEIRYCERGGAQRIPRLGGRLLNVDPRDRRQIEQFVTALDREMQRKQIKLEE